MLLSYQGRYKVLLCHRYALTGTATDKDMQENKTLTCVSSTGNCFLFIALSLLLIKGTP